jgi:hypothetical protein
MRKRNGLGEEVIGGVKVERDAASSSPCRFIYKQHLLEPSYLPGEGAEKKGSIEVHKT